MTGKIIGAVILIALIAYGYTVMNQATSGIENDPAVQQLQVDIKEQLKEEGLPPQPAPINSAQ